MTKICTKGRHMGAVLVALHSAECIDGELNKYIGNFILNKGMLN